MSAIEWIRYTKHSVTTTSTLEHTMQPLSATDAITVLSTLPDGLILTNPQDRIVWLNPAAARMFGLDPDQWCGRLWSEVTEHLQIAETVYGEHSRFWHGDIKYSMRTQTLAIGPRTQAAPHTLRIFAPVPKDIQYFETFISILSHELRTPLTGVIGYANILQTNTLGPLTPDQRDLLSGISKYGNRISQVITECLFMVGLQQKTYEANPKSLLLAESISKAIESVTAQFSEYPRTITRREDNPLQRVYCDSYALNGFLIQLLAQAIRFTPENGQIQIVVTDHINTVQIEIIDNGIGIPAEHLPHVFELDNQEFDNWRYNNRLVPWPDLHIGLWIAKQVTLLNGGDLTCTSIEGQGSTFCLTLPKGK